MEALKITLALSAVAAIIAVPMTILFWHALKPGGK
jgi:ABC-type sulfate transport system permease subunit